MNTENLKERGEKKSDIDIFDNLKGTQVFPKVADAASADSFQRQITLTSGRIVSVSDFWKKT